MELGIDWITASFRDHSQWNSAREMLMPHWIEFNKAGAGPQPRWRNGYYGLATQHSFIGRRDDGMMVEAHGALADHLFLYLARHADNISRLDVQLTLEPPEKPTAAIEKAYVQASKFRPATGRPPKVSYYGSAEGKETVYIGAPSSDNRARIYNKEQESRDDRFMGSVRYEVQLRRDRALAAAQYFVKASAMRTAMLMFVADWFRGRGVEVGNIPIDNFPAPKYTRPQKTYETRLHWLEDQVSPALKRLLEEVGPDATLKALLFCFQDVPEWRRAISLAVLAMRSV